MTPGVLILTGPTASGKSALGLALAERFGAEIIGADSRQIYRGMPIGTAAPTAADRARVSHHLVEVLDPHERYSAARFLDDALAAVDDIHRRGKRAIVAGGTGFYLRALTGDVALSPAYDPLLRERLAREARVHSDGFLGDWLRVVAPARAAAIARNDRYRITRALEIALAERSEGVRRDEAVGADNLRTRGIPYLKIALEVDPGELERRIAVRVDAMLAGGLLDEAQRVGAGAIAADAVGYREALAYLEGWSTAEELRTQLIRNTRRYAKRQKTWLRTEPGLVGVPADGALVRAAALAGGLPGWA